MTIIPSHCTKNEGIPNGKFQFLLSVCIKQNKVNPAPDEVPELIFCTCPRKCFRDTCPCVDNSVPCINPYVKQECENHVFCDRDIDDIEPD